MSFGKAKSISHISCSHFRCCPDISLFARQGSVSLLQHCVSPLLRFRLIVPQAVFTVFHSRKHIAIFIACITTTSFLRYADRVPRYADRGRKRKKYCSTMTVHSNSQSLSSHTKQKSYPKLQMYSFMPQYDVRRSLKLSKFQVLLSFYMSA